MSGFQFRERTGRKRVMLSITPLIDVLFLLIIFFTLTSTFKRVGELELQLPDSSTSSPISEGDEERPLELIATEGGELFLEGEGLALANLKKRLLESRKESPQRRILIKAEAGVDHGDVVLLLDIVRDSGFPGVGIGTHTKPPGEDGRS